MTIDDLSLATLRVAVIDHGIDGAPAELRRELGAARVVDVFPSLVPDDGGDDAGAGRHVQSGHPDAVLLTWEGGGELASVLAATRRVAPEAAIIVVLPHFDEAIVRNAIRLGAEDCVTAQQIESSQLLRVLFVAAERHRLMSSLRAAAYSDELTGLYNRRGYITRASTLLKVADPKTIWQIFFDVDDLKMVNDTYGHWAGDRALMEVAAVLRQAFRSSDIVARVGGDEFAVLAVAPADVPAEAWAARWRSPLAELASRRDLPLSVSVGLAQPDEQGQPTPEDLLTRADMTMYTAKRLRKKLADTPVSRTSPEVLAVAGD